MLRIAILKKNDQPSTSSAQWKRWLAGLVASVCLLPVPVYAGLTFDTWSIGAAPGGFPAWTVSGSDGGAGANSQLNINAVGFPTGTAMSGTYTITGHVTWDGNGDSNLDIRNGILNNLSFNGGNNASITVRAHVVGDDIINQQFSPGTLPNLGEQSDVDLEDTNKHTITVTFKFTNVTSFTVNSTSPATLNFGN